jgi:hypothetical protein
MQQQFRTQQRRIGDNTFRANAKKKTVGPAEAASVLGLRDETVFDDLGYDERDIQDALDQVVGDLLYDPDKDEGADEEDGKRARRDQRDIRLAINAGYLIPSRPVILAAAKTERGHWVNKDGGVFGSRPVWRNK